MTVWFRQDRQRWAVDVDFEYPDGRRVRIRKLSPVNSKAGALEYERQVRAELLDPTRQVQRGAPRFADFVRDRWWPVYPTSAMNKPTTILEKKYHLEVHLVPFFGEMPLDEIRKERLDHFVASLRAKDLSQKRIKNVVGTLRRILASAVEWEVLPELPAFPNIKCPDAGFDFYVKEESDRIIASCKTLDERAILTFALRTGARAGEQIALLWSAVDLHNNLVTFRRSSSNGVVTESAKSGRERRVPFGPGLRALLLELRDLKRGPLVFCNPDGSPRSLWQLRERLITACRRSNVRELRWHDLRHSFASQLAIAGTPIPQIKEWLGHATINMTMRYAHLAPGGGREFMAALD